MASRTSTTTLEAITPVTTLFASADDNASEQTKPSFRILPSDQHQALNNWQFAGPYDPWVDPERFEAANNHEWDYAFGNPINPVKQGHNIAIRPFSSGFVYFRLQGVNLMGVSPMLQMINWH